jgi:hypothetical protein
MGLTKDPWIINRVMDAVIFCKLKKLKRRFKFLGFIRMVNPNSRTKANTQTFLMTASKVVHSSIDRKDQEQIVKYLIDNGADLDLKSCDGATALHFAINDKLTNIIKILVEKGANINSFEFSRKLSPLMLACWLEYQEVAIQLIELGADINLSDYCGFTAIDYAVDSSLDKVVEILKSKGCSQLKDPPVPIRKIEWHTGAKSWEEYAEGFSRNQLWRNKPAFEDLVKRIAGFSNEQKHAIWWTLGGNCNAYDRNFAAACYIEALWADPDPTSVVWGWLTGELDKNIKLLSPDAPRNSESIRKIRERWGIDHQILIQ